MRIPKRYGQSKIDKCPFCERTATTKNQQGVPVCESHKKKNLENLRCACGGWLDVQSGKWGAYFRCLNCGNINFQKALEMNPQVGKDSEEEAGKKTAQTHSRYAPEKKENTRQTPDRSNNQRKEIVIRSDDPNYFY